MSVTGLSKGLSQVGRYILNRKQQERQAQSRFALENLKNQMWKNRLREETLRKQQEQQFLLEKHTKQQEEMTNRAKIKSAADLDRFNRLKDIEEKRLGLQKQKNEIDKLKAQAGLSKERRLSLDKKKKDIGAEIRALDVVRDNLAGRMASFEETITDFESGGETTTKGQKWYGRDEKGLANIEELMNQKVYELMGQKPPVQPQTKTDKSTGDIWMRLSYQRQLEATGVPRKKAMELTEQKFGKLKGQPAKINEGDILELGL